MELIYGIDLIVAVALFVLLFYVLIANEIRQLHKLYFVFHTVMMLWPIGMFSIRAVSDPFYVASYLYLACVGFSFLGYGWLMFTLIVTKGLHRLKPKPCFLLGLPAYAALLYVVLGSEFGSVAASSGLLASNGIAGTAVYFVSAVNAGYILIGSLLMVRALKRSTDVRFRKYMALFLLGQVIMLGFLTAYAFVGISGLISIGILLSDVCFVIAIYKHDVFRIISVALREVVDNMEAGIFILDEHNIIIERNAEAKRFYPSAVGQSFPIEMIVEDALEPSFGKGLIHSFYNENGKPLQTEVLVRNPFPVYVSVRITPIYSNNGTYIGRTAILQDVTEWRRLVHDLYESNEDLKLRNSELMLTQEELSLANRKLEKLAITDPLTGCYNRRYLFQMLEHQLAIEQRYQVPFSLLVFDIDHFKQINDSYGHHMGDEVLRKIARVVKGKLRESDIFARVGGEEFTVYLPHTEKRYAVNLAERLRKLIESYVIPTEQGDIRITISIGLISIDGNSYHGEPPQQFLEDVMKRVDAALYEAKGRGRNQIVIV